MEDREEARDYFGKNQGSGALLWSVWVPIGPARWEVLGHGPPYADNELDSDGEFLEGEKALPQLQENPSGDD